MSFEPLRVRSLETIQAVPGGGLVPQVMTLANAFELGENPTEVRLNMTLPGLTKLNVKPQRHLTLRKAQRRDLNLQQRDIVSRLNQTTRWFHGLRTNTAGTR